MNIVIFYKNDVDTITGQLICWHYVKKDPPPIVTGNTFEEAFAAADRKFGVYQHGIGCKCPRCDKNLQKKRKIE
jgi:hypothetical protein